MSETLSEPPGEDIDDKGDNISDVEKEASKGSAKDERG